MYFALSVGTIRYARVFCGSMLCPSLVGVNVVVLILRENTVTGEVRDFDTEDIGKTRHVLRRRISIRV